MSIIQAAGSGEVSTGFYKLLLDQSLKFDDGLSQRLQRTPASAGNRRTFTFSCWVKRSTITADQAMFAAGADAQNRFQIYFLSNDKLGVYGNTSNSDKIYAYTDALFRDTSAWYNVVVEIDSTDGTASNRLKMYVNGVEQSYTYGTTPSQNEDFHANNTVKQSIGSDAYAASNLFDGYIAEVNMIDGTALTADSFGETKNGIWIPKDTSGLTFGTNGFHLTFKDDVVSEGFNVVTYTGTSAGQSISGLGFSPAFVWVKSRGGTEYPKAFDVVRGANKDLTPAATGAEGSLSDALMSFDGDGFTLGDDGNEVVNKPSGAMVAWCWEGGGTPTATNSAGAGATPTAGSVKIDGSNLGSALAGSIAATKISANTSKGFSIVSYTGTGSAGTIAHGLGVAPKWLIIKERNATSDWVVGHNSLDASAPFDKGLYLNDTRAVYDDATNFNDTAPTSTVFSVGTGGYVNDNTNTYIAYCWAEVSGYSKFDSYSGNGSTTGPTITTGFRPAWVMIKSSVGTIGHWLIWDTTRSPSNPNDNVLYANLNNAESVGSSYAIEVTATGFQIKHNGSDVNTSGATYIYMAFADTRSAAFFKDVSTNGNNFTPVNLDYRDSVPDVPTNNFATFNPLNSPAAAVLSEGNTKFTQTSNDRAAIGNMAMSSGKWYYEVYYTAGSNPEAGLARIQDNFANSGATGSSDKFLYITNSTSFRTPAWTATDATGVSAQTSETILGFAVDADNGKAFISVNGTYINSGDPAAGSNPQATFDADWVTQTGGGVVPFIGMYTGTSYEVRINFGQDSSFSGVKATSNANADGEGHGSFQYAPPSGFLALCSQNLPDVDIIDSSDNFNTVLYTGNGTNPRSVTGVGFSPDFIWAKVRSNSYPHFLVNSVIGANKYLNTNSTDAETTTTGYYQSFDSDGFTVDNSGGINGNGETFVAWNWLAGTAFSNDASATGIGTVDSSGQVNTTAGFSIVSYTGTGSAGTIKHGLSAAPEMLIVKNRDTARDWMVYHSALGATKRIWLNYNLAEDSGTAASATWNDTAPTSTVFSVGTNIHANESGDDFICYAFHSVEGYSKMGSYVGNNNADGTFVFTGFRPAWVMVKAYSTGGTHYDWAMYDSVRSPTNAIGAVLEANQTQAEITGTGRGLPIDFVSNGFKFRSSYAESNAAVSYIYLAFAEQPFKFANAR